MAFHPYSFGELLDETVVVVVLRSTYYLYSYLLLVGLFGYNCYRVAERLQSIPVLGTSNKLSILQLCKLCTLSCIAAIYIHQLCSILLTLAQVSFRLSRLVLAKKRSLSISLV